MPYKNQVFDTVLLADALDHFADPKVALREVHRVLKPQGTILIVHSFRNEKYAKTFIKRIHTKLMLYLNKKAHNNTFENSNIKIYLQNIGFGSFGELNKLVKNSCVEISLLRAKKVQT